MRPEVDHNWATYLSHADHRGMPVIIVTDLNFPSDDFQALLLFLKIEELQLIHVVATDGNTWAEEVFENTVATLDGEDRSDISVSMMPMPYRHQHRGRAYHAFRKGYKSFIGPYLKSNVPRSEIEYHDNSANSVAKLAAVVCSYPAGVILASLGPFYPLAALLKQLPEIASNILRVIAMAGKFSTSQHQRGRADFNVWFDPASADTVFSSGIDILLLPRNACEGCLLSVGSLAVVEEDGLWGRRMFSDIVGMRSQHGPQMPLVDTLIPLILAQPRLIDRSRRGWVQVRRRPSSVSGQTYFRESPAGNVMLIDGLNMEEVERELLRRVGRSAASSSTARMDRYSDFPAQTSLKQRLRDRPLYQLRFGDSVTHVQVEPSEINLCELEKLLHLTSYLVSQPAQVRFMLERICSPIREGTGGASEYGEITIAAIYADLLAQVAQLDVIASWIYCGKLHGLAGISIPSNLHRLELNRRFGVHIADGDAIVELSWSEGDEESIYRMGQMISALKDLWLRRRPGNGVFYNPSIEGLDRFPNTEILKYVH